MKTKDQSVQAKGIAIGWFSKNEYTVSLPISRHEDYDILVDKDGKILKIRIISTNYKNSIGKWEVSLRQMCSTYSCGNTTKKFDNTSCDAVFMVCGTHELFLIPSADIHCTVKIIPECYPNFRINW